MFIRFLSLVLFVSYLQSTDYIDYPHPFHPTTTSGGMVVSQNASSSNIGIKILDMGGNAVDAAVAVGFSLAITLPRAGNIGGGGFMLIYIKDKEEVFYIDYRSKSPKNSSIEKLLGTKKDTGQKFKTLGKGRLHILSFRCSWDCLWSIRGS
jgi:gamma-glutamyltranspeptidase/glutathione hydrolase